VRYWPDRQIFLREATVSRDELHNRARQTAFLVPGLTITVRDERDGDPWSRRSASTGASASSASSSHPTNR
jgi:DNA gyrase subunit B